MQKAVIMKYSLQGLGFFIFSIKKLIQFLKQIEILLLSRPEITRDLVFLTQK